MNKTRVFLIAALCVFLAFIGLRCNGKRNAPGAADYTHYVRVAVLNEVPHFSLTINGPFQVSSLETGELLYASHILWNARVNASGQGIEINDRAFSLKGIKIEPLRSPSVYINKRLYRGYIDVLRRKEALLCVVNHVEMDDYLRGVLPNEVSPWWPIEALKAQAIVARTYALYQMKANAGKEYDLLCTSQSQVYGGRLSEQSRSSRAVKLTKGKVLAYNGKIIPAFYHACCGGHTENAAEIWNIDIVPLRGRECKYCRQCPYYRWRTAFSLKKMEQAMGKSGIKTGKIRAVKVAERDVSGRAMRVEIACSEGNVSVDGTRLRLLLDPFRIKSTHFDTRRRWWSVIFRGKGWGHGVGMCQWGAYGMSKRRYNCEQILNFYYPETKVVPAVLDYETF